VDREPPVLVCAAACSPELSLHTMCEIVPNDLQLHWTRFDTNGDYWAWCAKFGERLGQIQSSGSWLIVLHNGQYVDIGPPPHDLVCDDTPRPSTQTAPDLDEAAKLNLIGQKMPPHIGIPHRFGADVPKELALLLEAWRQNTLNDTILNRWYGAPSVSTKTHGEAFAGLRRNLLRTCHSDTLVGMQSIDPKGEVISNLTSTLNYEIGTLENQIRVMGWTNVQLNKPLPGTQWARPGGNARKMGSVSKITPNFTAFTLWESHASDQPRVPPAPPPPSSIPIVIEVDEDDHATAAGSGENVSAANPTANSPIAQAKRWTSRTPPINTDEGDAPTLDFLSGPRDTTARENILKNMAHELQARATVLEKKKAMLKTLNEELGPLVAQMNSMPPDDLAQIKKMQAEALLYKEQYVNLVTTQRAETYRYNNLSRGLDPYELAYDNLNCSFQDSPLRVNSNGCQLHVQNDYFWYKESGDMKGSWHALPDVTPSQAPGPDPLDVDMQAPQPGGLWTRLNSYVPDRTDYVPPLHFGRKPINPAPNVDSASETTAGGTTLPQTDSSASVVTDKLPSAQWYPGHPYPRIVGPLFEKNMYVIWVKNESWKCHSGYAWASALEEAVAYTHILEMDGPTNLLQLSTMPDVHVLCSLLDRLSQKRHTLADHNKITSANMFYTFIKSTEDPLPSAALVPNIPLLGAYPTSASMRAWQDMDHDSAFKSVTPTRLPDDLNTLRGRRTILVCDSSVLVFYNKSQKKTFESIKSFYEWQKQVNPWKDTLTLGGGGATTRTMVNELRQLRSDPVAGPKWDDGTGSGLRYHPSIDVHVFMCLNGLQVGNSKVWVNETKEKTVEFVTNDLKDLVTELSFFDKPTVTIGPNAAHWCTIKTFAESYDQLIDFMLFWCKDTNIYAARHTQFWVDMNYLRNSTWSWHHYDRDTGELIWHLDRMLVRLKCFNHCARLDRRVLFQLQTLLTPSDAFEPADLPPLKIIQQPTRNIDISTAFPLSSAATPTRQGDATGSEEVNIDISEHERSTQGVWAAQDAPDEEEIFFSSDFDEICRFEHNGERACKDTFKLICAKCATNTPLKSSFCATHCNTCPGCAGLFCATDMKDHNCSNTIKGKAPPPPPPPASAVDAAIAAAEVSPTSVAESVTTPEVVQAAKLPPPPLPPPPSSPAPSTPDDAEPASKIQKTDLFSPAEVASKVFTHTSLLVTPKGAPTSSSSGAVTTGGASSSAAKPTGSAPSVGGGAFFYQGKTFYSWRCANCFHCVSNQAVLRADVPFGALCLLDNCQSPMFADPQVLNTDMMQLGECNKCCRRFNNSDIRRLKRDCDMCQHDDLHSIMPYNILRLSATDSAIEKWNNDKRRETKAALVHNDRLRSMGFDPIFDPHRFVTGAPADSSATKFTGISSATSATADSSATSFTGVGQPWPKNPSPPPPPKRAATSNPSDSPDPKRLSDERNRIRGLIDQIGAGPPKSAAMPTGYNPPPPPIVRPAFVVDEGATNMEKARAFAKQIVTPALQRQSAASAAALKGTGLIGT
jgi:hypothetical protein